MGFAGEGNKFNTGKRNEVRKKKGYHSPLVLEIIIRYLGTYTRARQILVLGNLVQPFSLVLSGGIYN